MKKLISLITCLLAFISLIAACKKPNKTALIIQTSRSGDKIQEKEKLSFTNIMPTKVATITINPEKKFQKIYGFGGAFTESSAYVLKNIEQKKRKEVIDKYFSSHGAHYSLMRTHMNSCDFSLNYYSYADVPDDKELKYFTIKEDMDDLIPLIKDAMKSYGAQFKIIASPWTAPIWMKDNNNYKGGSLKKEYYSTWALFFSKYIRAYKNEGIDIWGLTVENEPLGNGAQWESMHFTHGEMKDFIKNNLGPQLKKDSIDTRVLIFDQNRDHVEEWAHAILGDKESAKYCWGTAVHWYRSTYDWFPRALTNVHNKFPGKPIIHTEGCIDNIGNDEKKGSWLKDDWYWQKEATDWGYVWASDKNKKLHPKYVPVYRYARNIIGSLNSWVGGWIDWNIVLDFQGGPNHADNFCLAPVLCDDKNNKVYYTPIYYIMYHFSKYMRPNGHRISVQSDINDRDIMITAVKNIDNSIAVAILNMSEDTKKYRLVLNKKAIDYEIEGQALQTIIVDK